MDTKDIMELKKDVVKLDTSLKTAHRRIDELNLVVKAFYKLASTVEVMVNEMTYMKKDVSDIKTSIKKYHSDDMNKLVFTLKSSAITAIVTAIVVALMNLIIK